ncbi:hypothetical protein, partial [Pseudomonas aeruginosa]
QLEMQAGTALVGAAQCSQPPDAARHVSGEIVCPRARFSDQARPAAPLRGHPRPIQADAGDGMRPPRGRFVEQR